MDDAIARIIDANLNRLREGLRVVEEYFRFALNNTDMAARLKAMRHEARELFSPEELQGMVRARDTEGDVGARTPEDGRSRTNAADVAAANLKRVQEALRVLEEYLKPEDFEKSKAFKTLRFDIYDVEKQLMGDGEE